MPFTPYEKYAPRIVLGTRTDNKQPFVLTGKPFKDHHFITGLTGVGKSRLIASMCVQLLNENTPFALLDPHQDLGDDILSELIALGFYDNPQAYEKLWYVDFTRRDAFIPFNVLAQPYPIDTVVLNTLEAWRRTWSSLSDGNAINIENVLRAATTVLIENNQPLTKLPQLLTDPVYRDAMLANSQDDLVLGWFKDRFSSKVNSLIDSTLKRVFVLTYSPTLRYTLGQLDNRLDARYLLDNGISVIYNLGGLDSETTRFLGCLITTGYEQAALSRVNMPEERRRPCHYFIDEFSQFVSGDGTEFERILTLTRKYGLTLNLACQTLSQTKEIKDALQNTLHISFQLGVNDATTVAPHFIESKKEPTFMQKLLGVTPGPPPTKAEWTQEIKGLPQQHCYIHLGGTSFQIRTLDMPDRNLPKGTLANVKQHYAQKLLVSQEKIDKQQNKVLHLVPQTPRPVNTPIPLQRQKKASPPLSPIPLPPQGKRARRYQEAAADDE